VGRFWKTAPELDRCRRRSWACVREDTNVIIMMEVIIIIVIFLLLLLLLFIIIIIIIIRASPRSNPALTPSTLTLAKRSSPGALAKALAKARKSSAVNTGCPSASTSPERPGTRHTGSRSFGL
jgi:hypothetical protein